MATTNITTTVVSFENIPIMIEGGWELVLFNPAVGAQRSVGYGSAILKKEGDWKCRADNGLQRGLNPKRGDETPG